MEKLNVHNTVELELFYKIVSYTPERPAPHAVDHDDPRFGDQGDDEEVEFELYLEFPKWKYNPKTQLSDLVYEYILITQEEIYFHFEEKIRELARNKYEGEIDEAIERRYEAQEENRRMREQEYE